MTGPSRIRRTGRGRSRPWSRTLHGCNPATLTIAAAFVLTTLLLAGSASARRPADLSASRKAPSADTSSGGLGVPSSVGASSQPDGSGGPLCVVGITITTYPSVSNVTRGGSSAYASSSTADLLRTTKGSWYPCGTSIDYYIYEWLRAGSVIYTSGHLPPSQAPPDHTVVVADLGASITSRVTACSNFDGCSTPALSSNSISALNRAPATPSSPSPANGAIVSNPPTLSAVFSDQDYGQTGHVQFFLSGNGGSPWGSTVSSGQASSTSVSLTQGTTYSWYAKATDLGAYAAANSGNTASYSFTVNSAPYAPGNPKPVSGRIENNDTPTFSSTFSDPQGSLGQTGYVIYTVKNPDGSVAATGNGSTVSSGSASTWTPSSGLHPGITYTWYAQAKDALGLTSSTVGPFTYIDQYRYGLRPQYTAQAFPLDDRESLAVNVGNGNLVLSARDLHLVGIAGFDLDYGRSYNSLFQSAQSLNVPTLATGWETLPSLGIYSNGDVRYSAQGGFEANFDQDGQGGYTAPPGLDSTLVKNGDGSYTLSFHATGAKQNFSSAGVLSSQVDQNGNTIAYSYSSGRLSSINDSFSRSTSFAYNGSNQLTTITDPANRTYQYGYSGSNLTSYTDPTGVVTHYAYDGSNRLTQVTDPDGNMTKIAYDTSSRVSSISRGFDSNGNCPSGQTCPLTIFSYGVAGGSFCPSPSVETDVTDPNIHLTKYCYDGELRVTGTKDPLNNPTSTSYTSGGSNCTDNQVCSTIDANNKSTSFSYQLGKPENLTQISLPNNGQPMFYYLDPNHPYYPSSSTDAERTRTTTYTYTSAGNLATETNQAGDETTYTYNSHGQILTEVAPLGNVSGNNPADYTTTYTYDAAGNLASVTDPLGNKTTYTYDAIGRKLTQVDPLGNVSGGNQSQHTTSYSYDGNDRLLSVTDQLGHTTSYSYDGDGNRTSVTDANSHVTSSSYNGLNQLVALTKPDPDGAGPLTAPVTNYGYDPAGNKTSETDPRQNTTSYTYDADNRLASETDPVGNKTTYTYDGNGNLATTVDPRGNVMGGNPADYTTSNTYTPLNQLQTTTDPLGHVTGYGYDADGNKTSLTDANTHSTTYGYDAAERLHTVTAPDPDGPGPLSSPVTTYGYDANGNKVTVQDANTHTTSYAYDHGNELTSVTTQLGNKTTYSYDANGNRLTLTDANGNASGGNAAAHTTTYGYDAANRLASISYGDGTTPNVGFGYDEVGNRTSMSDGAGTISYSYDNDDRMTGSIRGSDSFSYAYDAADNITSRTYPDGTAVSYGYDSDNRLASVTSGGATTSYAYDPASNVTQTTLPASNGYVETRSYDHGGRVIEVKNAKGGSVLSDFVYTLDPVGKPTSVVQSGATSSTTTYGYDNDDRLTEVCYQSNPCQNQNDPYIRWSYDLVGNRLTETRPSGTTTYSYNADDELTAAGSTSYSYDYNGNETAAGSRTFGYDLANRLSSTASGGTTTSYGYDGDGNRLSASTGGGGSNTTNYLWDTNNDLPQLALERDGNNTLLRSYLYGARRISMTSGGSSYYYAYDGLGSVVNLTSSSGATEWTYAYDPFGATRTETQNDPAAPVNGMRFTGEQLDPDGLYNLRARLYDTASGRFLQTDPASSPRSDSRQSTYIYAEDRPTVLSDPSGAIAIPCGSVVGVLAPLPKHYCLILIQARITFPSPALNYGVVIGLASQNGWHKVFPLVGFVPLKYIVNVRHIVHPGRGNLTGTYHIEIALLAGIVCRSKDFVPFDPPAVYVP
jgi:RHS repeat-associated protein